MNVSKQTEAVARAIVSVRAKSADKNWRKVVGEASAAIEALAANVSVGMASAFDKANNEYWDKHWSSPGGFGKVGVDADRVGISAAIRAAVEGK